MGSLVDLTQLSKELVNLKIGLLPKLEHKEEKKSKQRKKNKPSNNCGTISNVLTYT